MLRGLFFVLAFFSGIGLLGTVTVWPISHFRWVHAEYALPDRNVYQLNAHSGRMQFTYMMFEAQTPLGLNFHTHPLTPDAWSYLSWDFNASTRLNRTTLLGVLWLHDPQFRPYYIVDLAIPCSYLAILFALLPTAAFFSHRRRRKTSRVGLCRQCGYDLRAHHPGERCPECGTPIPAPA